MKFNVGDIVRARGEAGTFKILSFYSNGDVLVWGGMGGHLGIKQTTGHAQFRSFKPERLRLAKKPRR